MLFYRCESTDPRWNLALWEWNYGRSPDCTFRSASRIPACGTVEAWVLIEADTIRQVAFFGDFFGGGQTDALASALKGCPYRREAVMERLAVIPVSAYIQGLSNPQLLELLRL